MQLFSDRSETSSILPKLHFQAASRPVQAGRNPSLVVVLVAILLLILLFAGDHDRRWKWHRSVQKLLAGATASGRGRPSPFSTLIYFASLQFERILFPSYLLPETQAGVSLGPMILVFGCRRESMDLLRKETDKLGCVLSENFSHHDQKIDHR